MPIYDFKCPSCNLVLKDVITLNWEEKVQCKQCHEEMKRLFSPPGFFPKVFPADGIYLEHVSPTGKTFYSEKEMKEYAKKHDLELGALL